MDFFIDDLNRAYARPIPVRGRFLPPPHRGFFVLTFCFCPFHYPNSSPRTGGSSYVSWKVPTYPSPKPTLALVTSHLGQNVGLGEE